MARIVDLRTGKVFYVNGVQLHCFNAEGFISVRNGENKIVTKTKKLEILCQNGFGHPIQDEFRNYLDDFHLWSNEDGDWACSLYKGNFEVSYF